VTTYTYLLTLSGKNLKIAQEKGFSPTFQITKSQTENQATGFQNGKRIQLLSSQDPITTPKLIETLKSLQPNKR